MKTLAHRQRLARSRANLSRAFCATLLFAGAIALSGAEFNDDLKKDFEVKPGGELVMDVDFGAITITTGEGSKAAVEVTRRISRGGKSEAEAMFKAHEVTFDQDGSQVRVSARFKDPQRNRGRMNYQVDYRVRVPSQFNLNVRTGAGSVTVGNIEGTVIARSSGGNLKFDAVKGPLDANTAAGSITASSVSGKTQVRSSGGNISLGELQAETSADTAAGSITVKTAKAQLKLRTSGGNLEVGEIAGPADLSTAAGSIRVRVAAARLEAKSSGGNIQIDDARDAVQARTAAGSVSAGFSAQPKAECKLSSAGGNIEARLDEKLAFDLNARTAGGRVTSELPVAGAGDKKTSRLQGKLNGGGVLLLLETSAGNVTIKKQGGS